MSSGAESLATAPAQRHRRPGSANAALRGNVMGAIVMLLLQFGLGMGVNLYETMPAADHGKSVFAAFGRAVADGPVVLALHALLGTLLIGAGVGAFSRALRTGRAAQRVLTGLALAAILVAWLSGARFVGNSSNGASLTMALAFALALFGYVATLFLTPAAAAAGESAAAR